MIFMYYTQTPGIKNKVNGMLILDLCILCRVSMLLLHSIYRFVYNVLNGIFLNKGNNLVLIQFVLH